MRLVVRLIKESLFFAVQALRVNRLRSMLSLLGVTIGILCIISVLTMVDTLERNVRDGVSSLGDDVLFIQKWPWGGGPNYEWWKYWKRPHPRYSEFKELRQKSVGAQAMAFVVYASRQVSYKGKSIDNTDIQAVSENYDQVESVSIAHGRFFSRRELATGRNMAVIGYEIADNLFGNAEYAVGKTMKVAGQKVYIIGVFEKEGSGFAINGKDENVIVPLHFARSITNVYNADSSIMIRAANGVTMEELKDRLEGVFRPIRRVRPREESNFALNESSVISNQLDGLFGVMNITGFCIGLLSILVGGFSVANIMFVSVKERTHLIGIQKSLGAKNSFVLLQFIFESIFLTIVGGLIGLFIVFLGTVAASLAMDMSVFMSVQNIIIGLLISSLIGLIAGFAPALQAARLEPVVAIRSR